MFEYPVKVLHEYRTCDDCPKRKRTRYWMDGTAHCEDHLSRVPDFLRGMVYRIRYEVTR